MKVIVRPNGIYINKTRYNYTMLDNFIKSPVDLIDIDMYGSEIDVLKGAVQTLITYRPELDIAVHEDRIMKERERIFGFLALVCNLPIDVTETEDKMHVYIRDCPFTSKERAVTYFRGHKFEYYRYVGPEPIMYFTGWSSEVILREKLLRPNEVVYDVGAHIGAWTIPAALIGKHVYSFEPNIDCFNILNANSLLNNLQDKISIFNVGCGGPIRPCFNDNIVTDSIRIDDFIGTSPSFIKIDVEGAELDVLRGAQETIKRFKPRIFVETHGIGDYNTYEDVRDLVLEIMPDYDVESKKGAYHIFWP